MGGPFLIGVTGGIASGKSTVVGMLRDLGAEVIDADRVYHGMIAAGSPLLADIASRFGSAVIDPDGSLNRKALGGIVFADPAALSDLDRITHPAVIAAIDTLVAASASPVVAVDAIKLIESGHAEHCDTVWLVDCPAERQVERLVTTRGLDRREAERRVASRIWTDDLDRHVDVTIDNGTTLARTREHVLAAWDETVAPHLHDHPVAPV
ncbi:MAG: dephospho-CoA kinase [Chloroflexota bacterium]|nr:dephospho-CoA kinase [Chloroflexota bacterium]